MHSTKHGMQKGGPQFQTHSTSIQRTHSATARQSSGKQVSYTRWLIACKCLQMHADRQPTYGGIRIEPLRSYTMAALGEQKNNRAAWGTSPSSSPMHAPGYQRLTNREIRVVQWPSKTPGWRMNGQTSNADHYWKLPYAEDLDVARNIWICSS